MMQETLLNYLCHSQEVLVKLTLMLWVQACYTRRAEMMKAAEAAHIAE